MQKLAAVMALLGTVCIYGQDFVTDHIQTFKNKLENVRQTNLIALPSNIMLYHDNKSETTRAFISYTNRKNEMFYSTVIISEKLKIYESEKKPEKYMNILFEDIKRNPKQYVITNYKL